MSALALVLALASSACSPRDLWPTDDADVCRTTRTAPALSTQNASDAVDVEATSVKTSLAALEVDGSGGDFVGAITLSRGAGTIELACNSMPLVVYDRVDDGDYQWFFTVAVRDDRWYSVELVCEAGELQWVTYVGTDGTSLAYEAASGSCEELSAPATARVKLPASRLLLPSDAVTGYTIDGPSIQLAEDGFGSVKLDETQSSMRLFAAEPCADCETDRIHLFVLIQDETAEHVTLADLYYKPEEETLEVVRAVALPGLDSPAAGLAFAATVTTP